MTRRPVLITLVLASLFIAACSGSDGTTTDASSPAPSTSVSDRNTPADSSVPSRSGSSSTPSDRSSADGVPTPSVTAPAQDAVEAYVADFNLGTSASRDPGNADLSWIARYETGKVKKQTAQSFAYMKVHGLAYRGATPDPNVKVQSVLSSSVIVLTSCLIVSKSDPWTQYVVKTGKPVSSPSPRNPPPPYLLRIYMKANAKGAWQIENVLQDTSKTCKG